MVAVTRVSMERFRELVADALDELPVQFQALMQNVEVVVQEEPSPELARQFQGLLLGLYQGVPLNRRSWMGMQLPDKISIYRRNILRVCADEEQIREQVKTTVMHEIGHHFGMNERELRDAGY